MEISIDRYWVTTCQQSICRCLIIQGDNDEERSGISLSSAEMHRIRELTLPRAGPESNLHSSFLEPVMPLPRLMIAGAGHIGRALSHLGRLLDFEVTVIDDRASMQIRQPA